MTLTFASWPAAAVQRAWQRQLELIVRVILSIRRLPPTAGRWRRHNSIRQPYERNRVPGVFRASLDSFSTELVLADRLRPIRPDRDTGRLCEVFRSHHVAVWLAAASRKTSRTRRPPASPRSTACA